MWGVAYACYIVLIKFLRFIFIFTVKAVFWILSENITQ